MAFPKPSPELTDLLDDLMAEDLRVQRKKMFGCPALFCANNAHMFGGVFGDCLNVRLSEEDREAAKALGAHTFDPMGGRPMKEYVCLPEEIVADAEATRGWLEKAYAFASSLPPKKKRAKKKEG